MSAHWKVFAGCGWQSSPVFIPSRLELCSSRIEGHRPAYQPLAFRYSTYSDLFQDSPHSDQHGATPDFAQCYVGAGKMSGELRLG